MNEEILKEFLAIGNESQEDAHAIFVLTTKYLDQIKDQGYQPESATLIEGLINKITTVNEALGLDDGLVTSIEKNLTNFVNTMNSSPVASVPYFNKLYSDTMKFYNGVLKLKPRNTINLGPFRPDNSDRKTISHLISEAIELIQNTVILKDKAKQSLVDKLSQVIVELNNPKTDWNIYFKQVGYAITFLGTLGGIAGGAESVKNLWESRDKLVQANNAVEKTSTTISQNDIMEVFNLENNQMINTSSILQIEDKSNKTEK